MYLLPDDLNFIVLIKGAGDLASGVAVRLHRCGLRLAMTELPQPLMVRRTVSFGEAVYAGQARVEGVSAVRVEGCAEAKEAMAGSKIPILVDPDCRCLNELQPAVVIDAIMAKTNPGTRIDDASLVVALGPGFTAGKDCHAVIETNRGHRLGRVIRNGSAEADTGQPGEIQGKTNDRILRAPVSGTVETFGVIGERVTEGQALARVAGIEVCAEIPGVLRGMIHTGVEVEAGMKIGDIDPRGESSHCYQVSDKSLAIAGGVLEAILSC